MILVSVKQCTDRAEIKTGRIPGSSRSMQSYLLTVKGEPLAMVKFSALKLRTSSDAPPSPSPPPFFFFFFFFLRAVLDRTYADPFSANERIYDR